MSELFNLPEREEEDFEIRYEREEWLETLEAWKEERREDLRRRGGFPMVEEK